MAGKTIHAYTKEEWGVGASSGGGRQYAIRAFYFSLAPTVLMAPAIVGCLVLGIVGLFSPVPIMTVVMLFFGAIFGLAFIQGYFNLSFEWRGWKLRKVKGLPKPWFTASDDQAYEGFREHTDPRLQMTREHFPESVALQHSESRGTP